MYEIERRFLGRITAEEALRASERIPMRQAYLTDLDPTSVRVRERPDRHILTIKSGSGRVRREVEVEIDAAAAEALFEIAGDQCVEKVRHVVGRWEIDLYSGALDGLVIVEVELEREDEPLPEPPDGVRLIREVTEESGFTAHDLARLSPEEARRFVERVREG